MRSLTFEEIRSISFGATSIEQKADGVHYRRGTSQQIEAWRAMHPDLGERAGYSSGIVLDFHTDSKKLFLAAANGTNFEVYINQNLRAVLNLKEQRRTGRPAEIALCDALGDPFATDCRVTVYFPRGNDPAVISLVAIDGGASIEPHRYASKMLFYGDSITQGCSPAVHGFCYTRLVADFFNAEALNLGVGGGRFDPSTVDAIDFLPDHVMISFGTNDYCHYQTLDDLRNHADAFLKAVKDLHKATAKQFFVISPLWRGDLKSTPRAIKSFADVRKTLAELAEKHNMIHIDGLSLVPPFPDYFRDEYLHPNDLGGLLYAQGVIRAILPYMKQG